MAVERPALPPDARPGVFKRRMLRLGLGLLLSVGVILAFVLFGGYMDGFDPQKLDTTETDVTYCTRNGLDLQMDISYPAFGGPWPVLLIVHGGGWSEGDKADLFISPTGAGLLVVSINYRLYPAARFPAMIEDVKCALRFLRAHAGRYNLDPQRIALVGYSAGAHLAALAGLADPSAGWDSGPYPFQSSRVQAVVVIAGPANLGQSFPETVADLIEGVFGPQQLVSGSPVTYARPDAPPFLIIHGDADPLVPVEQAYLLHEALQKAGARAELLIVKNGGHGLEAVGGEASPAPSVIFQQVLEFLARSLGPS